MGTSRHEELATTGRPAWAEMISLRRAAARPRLVRRRADQFFCAANFFSARMEKWILSPTNRRRRSPVAGDMMGKDGSIWKSFSRKRPAAKSKSKTGFFLWVALAAGAI